ncbi:hypothetical protein O0L34_g13703 [Tuta absoluta]|nr:hypothetical protein O0L34_g17086 [Tuta absoluta]KAJ2951554.1 hypothetical protein O0L34_g13703 [Tuta absoluta]
MSVKRSPPNTDFVNPQRGVNRQLSLDDSTIVDKSYDTLITEIKLLREDINSWKTHVNQRLDDLEGRLSKSEADVKDLQRKNEECILLRSTVLQLQEQLNQQSQAALSSDIELLGLEELNNENLQHLTLVAATKIGVNLSAADINTVHRMGPRKKSQPNLANSGESLLPRPVVIRFTRKAVRDEFLKAALTRRNLDSKDITESGPQRKLYVNERLSSGNRHLFRITRDFTKNTGYKFCWSRGGNIFIRKREGSPAIRIRCEGDLHKLEPNT